MTADLAECAVCGIFVTDSVRSEIEFPDCIVRATSDGRTWTRRK